MPCCANEPEQKHAPTLEAIPAWWSVRLVGMLPAREARQVGRRYIVLRAHAGQVRQRGEEWQPALDPVLFGRRYSGRIIEAAEDASDMRRKIGAAA